jgi:hypothetical protein
MPTTLQVSAVRVSALRESATSTARRVTGRPPASQVVFYSLMFAWVALVSVAAGVLLVIEALR